MVLANYLDKPGFYTINYNDEEILMFVNKHRKAVNLTSYGKYRYAPSEHAPPGEYAEEYGWLMLEATPVNMKRFYYVEKREPRPKLKVTRKDP